MSFPLLGLCQSISAQFGPPDWQHKHGLKLAIIMQLDRKNNFQDRKQICHWQKQYSLQSTEQTIFSVQVCGLHDSNKNKVSFGLISSYTLCLILYDGFLVQITLAHVNTSDKTLQIAINFANVNDKKCPISQIILSVTNHQVF